MNVKSTLLVLVSIIAMLSCSKDDYQLTYPANALTYDQSVPGVSLHKRGLDWDASGAELSFTLHRPLDYEGGKINLAFFYQVMDDTAGTIELSVTPVAFKHESSFETYGSIASGTLNAPETLNALYEQTITIESGSGFSTKADWWFFRIKRQGTYNGTLRLMSVAVGYK